MKTKDLVRIFYKKLIPKKRRNTLKSIRKQKSKIVSKQDSDNYYEKLDLTSTRLLKEKLDLNEALKPLYEVFNDRSVRCELIGNDWWKGFVIASGLTDTEGKEIQEKLAEDINSLDGNLLEHWELLHIYALAVRVGLLVVGYAVRQKARESAIGYLKNKKRISLYKMRSALAVLLETEQLDELNHVLSSLGKRYDSEKKLFRHVQNLLYNKNDQIKKENFKDSEKDLAFSNYIKGKKIAIVGPAKTTTEDAAEIDSFDLVVRCNYKEKGVGVDEIIKGLRCDVSYFNFEQVRYFLKERKVNWPEGISWVVCKSRSGARKIKEKIDGILQNTDKDQLDNLLKTRFIKNFKDTIFMNTPNAMSNITMDLLRFEPMEIKIFHADMMLTVTRNNGYYPSLWERENNMERTFLKFSSRSHEPVIQYWILYTLFKNGKIGGDKRFEEVMMMGEIEYIKQLQHIYGNAGRLINKDFH